MGVPTMSESTMLPSTPLLDYEAIERAHELAARDALLEHARMGRSVHQQVNGTIVEVTPAEIFARYGLDENGKPKA